jgi:hypothetical protein
MLAKSDFEKTKDDIFKNVSRKLLLRFLDISKTKTKLFKLYLIPSHVRMVEESELQPPFIPA